MPLSLEAARTWACRLLFTSRLVKYKFPTGYSMIHRGVITDLEILFEPESMYIISGTVLGWHRKHRHEIKGAGESRP